MIVLRSSILWNSSKDHEGIFPEPKCVASDDEKVFFVTLASDQPIEQRKLDAQTGKRKTQVEVSSNHRHLSLPCFIFVAL